MLGLLIQSDWRCFNSLSVILFPLVVISRVSSLKLHEWNLNVLCNGFVIMLMVMSYFVCRCPWLTKVISPAVPLYNGLVFLFVLANFSMATFMDPGVYPRGLCAYLCVWKWDLVPGDDINAVSFPSPLYILMYGFFYYCTGQWHHPPGQHGAKNVFYIRYIQSTCHSLVGLSNMTIYLYIV